VSRSGRRRPAARPGGSAPGPTGQDVPRGIRIVSPLRGQRTERQPDT
jgi:hypothetical protein